MVRYQRRCAHVLQHRLYGRHSTGTSRAGLPLYPTTQRMMLQRYILAPTRTTTVQFWRRITYHYTHWPLQFAYPRPTTYLNASI